MRQRGRASWRSGRNARAEFGSTIASAASVPERRSGTHGRQARQFPSPSADPPPTPVDNRPACGKRPSVGSICYGTGLDRLAFKEIGLSRRPGWADFLKPELIETRRVASGLTRGDRGLTRGVGASPVEVGA
ncbi:hypothetical protein Misp05_08640 [Micromonospora sp. NBRC 107095]|nr:hypothetical protein Misp05_08640 [Micromonospora sp. NBRC 107095]